MEDNPYNRKVLEKLKEIDNSYLSHLKMSGKSVLDSDLVPLVKPNVNYEGSGAISGLLGMLGLGKEGKKGKKKLTKKDIELLTGSGILSGLLGSIGLGKEGGIIKTAGYGGKASKSVISGNVGGFKARAIGSGKAEMEGNGFFDKLLAESVDNTSKPKICKGGSVGVQAMAEQSNLLTKKKGGKKAEMEAGGFFDNIVSSVGNAIKTAADVAPSAFALAKLMKGRGMEEVKAGAKNKGVKSGEIKGKKTSPWIAHCKAYAKKHKIPYRDALKQAKASYKK